MVHRKSWGRIVAIVILGLAALCAPASSQQFSTPKNVSNNSDFSFTPQLAVDLGGNIYVVWEDDTDTNSNILFSRSTDGGTFSAPKGVSNSAGFSFNPRIAVDSGGTINVVWQDSPDFYRTSNVFFSRSSDGGITFSTPMNLSGTSNSAFYSTPQIAVHNAGNISVVWESDTGNLAIWFSGSTDGGATFSAPKMLSTNTAGSIDPQIAVDKNGNINVLWEDDLAGHSDISFSRSADNGATFSSPMNLSNPFGNSLANSNSPRLAPDLLGNINVVWANDSPGNFEIFISRSTDGGVNFSGPKNISRSSTFSSNPFIAVDAGGNINVVWADIEPADFNTDIFFARSSDGGATFSTAQNVSRSSGFSSNPWLTVDAGANINVSWEDNTPGNRDIFFARSTDSGATFPAPVNLSADSGLSLAAQIAADKNGNINVAWQDHTPGISQIFFSRLPADVGANQPPTIVTPPANQTVTAGQTATFSITASGTAPLSYQWQENGADVSGATSASYTTAATTAQDNGAQFRVMVSNPAGSATSGMATLTVDSSPTIVTPPANQKVVVGQTATFSITASGTAPLSYKWQKNGADINGATLASYTTPAATAQDNGAQFRVVVSNSAGKATSGMAALTVDSPPTIVTPPANQKVVVGQTATFSITASGTAPLSYKWQKNGADINGATLASYTTPAATAQDNGAQFRVVASNSAGKATSNPATLTVNSPPECSPTLRVSLSPDTLWPPNHKLVQITATLETSDGCDANPAVTLESITSNEPDNGLDDGGEPNDIQAVGGGPIPFGTYLRSFLLRAERSGMGAGRVYTVNYMVRDASGNKILASAQVSVGSQATEASPNRSGRKK